jgi:endonuclease G
MAQEVFPHTLYTATYDTANHYPTVVEWWETRARVSCPNAVERKNTFAPDPLDKAHTNMQTWYDVTNKAHKAAGKPVFDRGHMCPAADNECNGEAVERECFYFSNMAPQYHSLNAGDWKRLEDSTRAIAKAFDSIHVWCGNLGIIEPCVPETCWKVLYIKATGEWLAYMFKNTPDKPKGLTYWVSTVADIEAATGLKFQ